MSARSRQTLNGGLDFGNVLTDQITDHAVTAVEVAWEDRIYC
jgi:hypothetical protein